MAQRDVIQFFHPLITIRPSTINFDKTRWADLKKGLKKQKEETPSVPINQGDDATTLTDLILSSYKTGASESRSTWMNRLADESMRFLARQRGIKLRAIQQETTFNQAVADLVTRIFDRLHTYSFDFNHVMGWNELRITCTKPSLVTEVLRYNKFREPVETVTNFRARLSTRFMSLVVRGSKDEIEFLYLPVEKVIGLTRAECAYEPVCRIKGVMKEDKVVWQRNDHDLSEEELELLCMDLFTGLIERTKNESQVDH